jgi:hypothetical protein
MSKELPPNARETPFNRAKDSNAQIKRGESPFLLFHHALAKLAKDRTQT